MQSLLLILFNVLVIKSQFIKDKTTNFNLNVFLLSVSHHSPIKRDTVNGVLSAVTDEKSSSSLDLRAGHYSHYHPPPSYPYYYPYYYPPYKSHYYHSPLPPPPAPNQTPNLTVTQVVKINLENYKNPIEYAKTSYPMQTYPFVKPITAIIITTLAPILNYIISSQQPNPNIIMPSTAKQPPPSPIFGILSQLPIPPGSKVGIGIGENGGKGIGIGM